MSLLDWYRAKREQLGTNIIAGLLVALITAIVPVAFVAALRIYQFVQPRLFPPTPYRDVVLKTPGLISYWRLNEAFGPRLYDTKRQQYNGIYEGQLIEWRREGIPGTGAATSVSLNGPRGHIRIPDEGPSTGSLYDLDAFTIEFWIYLDEFTGSHECYRDLIKKGQLPHERNFGLYLLSGSASKVIGSFGKSASTSVLEDHDPFLSTRSQDDISRSEWHHIALVHPGGGNLRLYIDGSFASSNELRNVPVTSADPITIGSLTPIRPTTGLETVPCEVDTARRGFDEVAIYGRVLSKGEVAEHYRAGMKK